MPRILQSKKAVKIEVIGENIFLLDFASVVDRRYALNEGPWTFFKDLVIFQAPSGFRKAASMLFDEVPIWVQCHNLPLIYMHSSILQNVGARLGKVLEIEAGEDGCCAGKYARIRVMLDISKPLRQGIWVKQEKAKRHALFFYINVFLSFAIYVAVWGMWSGIVLRLMMHRRTFLLVYGFEHLRVEEIKNSSLLTTKEVIAVDLNVIPFMGLVRGQMKDSFYKIPIPISWELSLYENQVIWR